MKKVISTLLVAAMVFCSTNAKADNVNLQEAKTAAAYFMANYKGVDRLTDKEVVLVHQIDNEKLGIPAAYFFNIGSNGWIILAGTTVIDPIIGYSEEGTLVMENLPANMMWWVNGYADMVSEVQELDAENDYPDHERWVSFKENKDMYSSKGDVQHKLMAEVWGQGDDNRPTYNKLCPQNSQGRYAVTGCVATALAQIIHYYRSPQQPTGIASYWLRSQTDDTTMPNVRLRVDFDTIAPFNFLLMPNVPVDSWGRQQCTDAEMYEVARLSYYVGLSVKMAYSPDGSGALSQDVPNSMKKYFKYTESTLRYRNGNTDWTYVNAIRSELLNGNPLYMSGASSTGSGGDAAGHAWVCSGYKEQDTSQYYMNWGWDGGGNGFFNLGANRMPISGYGYNFNVRQAVILNMHPTAAPQGIADVDHTLLESPYPNPAVQTVTLPFYTENASNLMVYSIDGKLVTTCRVQAGYGEATVDVNNLPAGVYIYRLNSQSGKFIVQ